VEANNHRQLKNKVGDQDITEDLPLVLGRVLDSLLLDLVFLEGGDLIGNEVRDAAGEVDDLVGDEEEGEGDKGFVAALKHGLPFCLDE
jgi:hypothetical protein